MNDQRKPANPTTQQRIERYCEAVPVIQQIGCKLIVVGYVSEKRVTMPIERKAA